MSETLTQERLEELADPATCLPSFAELRSIISELQSARSRIAALKGALEQVDHANKTCPINNGDPRQRMVAKCLKCGATDDQNCGPNVNALAQLELAVRSALSPNDALNTRGE